MWWWIHTSSWREIRGKHDRSDEYDFLQVLSKCIKQFSKHYPLRGPPGACYMTVVGGVVKKIFTIFEYIQASFLIFLHEVLFGARTYRVIVLDIKSLIISTLATLEKRFRVPPILADIKNFRAIRCGIIMQPTQLAFVRNTS